MDKETLMQAKISLHTLDSVKELFVRSDRDHIKQYSTTEVCGMVNELITQLKNQIVDEALK